MKATRIIAVFILFLTLGITQSCIKHATAPISTEIIDFNATYKIVSYVVNGVENMDKYTDYEFQFNNAGIITANKMGVIANGNFSQQKGILEIRNYLEMPLSGLNYNWNVFYINSDRLDLYVSTGTDERRLILQFLR